MITALDKKRVEARIEDWEKRLNDLCGMVEGFANTCGKPCLKGQILQRLEQPMMEFEVPPRLLPTIAVLNGMKRVSFVPSTLWILGADGRVNVSTNLHQYILVDTRKSEEFESDWRIYTSKLAKPHEFDLPIFTQLLENQELD
jgi:hypothetical protein